jgi:hypothetical protein
MGDARVPFVRHSMCNAVFASLFFFNSPCQFRLGESCYGFYFKTDLLCLVYSISDIFRKPSRNIFLELLGTLSPNAGYWPVRTGHCSTVFDAGTTIKMAPSAIFSFCFISDDSLLFCFIQYKYL